MTSNAPEDLIRIANHKGMEYLAFLSCLHKIINPQTYLEIGSRTGSSLALANCESIAIDPYFNLNSSFSSKKSVCHLYQMTSDLFFRNYNPVSLLNKTIDFAFLDGMHLAEFLLRDFMNVEQYCRKDSIIAIHDCIPIDAGMARRVEQAPASEKSQRHPNWWTGDVWKVIPILKVFRPDLRVYLVDAAPTGIVLITNLTPTSRILHNNYFEISEGFLDSRPDALKTFLEEAVILSTSDLCSMEGLSRYLSL